MRYTALAPLLLLAACGTGTPNSNEPAFTIQSTDVTIMPGQEATYCYYFHTPNTKPIAVNKWISDMTPGSHHMIFFTGGNDHPDGLDTDNTCGVNFESGNLNLQSWVFATQQAYSEQPLPTDDGTGKPLAQVIQPNTLGAFQMHYLNQDVKPLVASVKLEAYALADDVQFTQTAPYITYNFDIAIPPMAIGTTATASCDAPPGKFWQMSTHAHKQAVKTEVYDGAKMMFESTDWEHPGAAVWDSTPFFTVESGKVSWTCTYNNFSDRTVIQGQSAEFNEMCMAVGYSFPATSATGCAASSKAPNGCFCLPL